MSGSLGTTSVPDLCPAPGHTPFSVQYSASGMIRCCGSPSSMVGLLLAYQLVVTLLQPVWIVPVTDWLRALLAWPGYLGGAAQRLVHADRSVRSLLVAGECRPAHLRGSAHPLVGGRPVSAPQPRPVSFLSRSLLCPPISLLSPGAAPGAAVRPMERVRDALDACLLLGAALALSWYFLLAPLISR